MTNSTDVREKLRAVDIVFVIDTTSSMGSFISEVKTRLQEFAKEISKAEIGPRLAYGVVAYRDHPPEDMTYVTRVIPLSTSVAQTQQEVGKLKAEGGGDGPEAVLDGLNDALNKIMWREHSHNIILLVGDAPPHGYGDSGDKFPKGCPCGLTIEKITAQAEKRAATIFAVGAGDSAEMKTTFQRIAKPTGGEFVALSDVRSLIPKILELLRREMGKVAADISVFTNWQSGMTADEIARATGRPRAEVDESLKRLSAKGVTPTDPTRSIELDAFLSRTSATDSLPTLPSAPTVDAEILDLIRIVEPSSKDKPSASDASDIDIVLHDT